MRLFSLSVTAALLSLGCGNGNTVVAPPAETKSEKSEPRIETNKGAERWGTVTGRLTWGEKELPAAAKLVVNKDEMQCLRKGPIYGERYVVNKANKGVANVFVWLLDATDPAHPKAPPIHPSLKEAREKEVVIDQPCCKFEPHAVALREGQVLIAKNSSDILHNFDWVGGEGQSENRLVPARGQITIDVLEASQKPFSVQCAVHPWMSAYFRVFDHPYFAVTDGDGKFEMKHAPAGKYNIVMWHEGMGWIQGVKTGRAIDVKAGGITEADGEVVPAKE